MVEGGWRGVLVVVVVGGGAAAAAAAAAAAWARVWRGIGDTGECGRFGGIFSCGQLDVCCWALGIVWDRRG
jgi:hypothetical protein